MSSKKHKRQMWYDNIEIAKRVNTTRLRARWYAIYITKDAFRTKQQKKNMKLIETLLKERGVKVRKPIAYKNR